ncbi:MAG: hypothetical protein WC483_05750 [Candidatus Paceibacterota bacterium]|nr:hypothetical protein [Candidatus Paceibacterota bacterium]
MELRLINGNTVLVDDQDFEAIQTALKLFGPTVRITEWYYNDVQAIEINNIPIEPI